MAVDLFSQGAPSLAAVFEQKLVVGIGNIAVSNNPSHILSTYALGSCVAVACFDPIRGVGGLIHIMLPDSRNSGSQSNRDQPCKYGDLGMPYLITQIQRMGANPRQTVYFLAGGARVTDIQVGIAIGIRNAELARSYLKSNRLTIKGEDCGGTQNRTLHLRLSVGTLEICSPSGKKKISLKG